MAVKMPGDVEAQQCKGNASRMQVLPGTYRVCMLSGPRQEDVAWAGGSPGSQLTSAGALTGLPDQEPVLRQPVHCLLCTAACSGAA